MTEFLVVPADRVNNILDAAENISVSEAHQVEKIQSGIPFEQVRFDLYLEEKKKDPTLTLGVHVKKLGRYF